MDKPSAERDASHQSGESAPTVAIVGGGLLGMSMALRLAQAGARVTLFEASPSAGGLAGEAQFGPYRWDRFYHVILLSDLRTRGLIDELGLSDELRWGISKTGFFTGGKLYSMSNTLEFLRFPPLNLLDKLRLGATIFLGSRVRRPDKLEKILAVDWLGKYSGKRVLEKIWLPLLKSKLGKNYRIASAAFIWAIIARMYAARRSGLKQEMFGYLAHGYGPVIRALERKLQHAGVTVCVNSPVTSLRSADGRVSVTVGDSEPQVFNQAVVTTPPPVAARICPELTADEVSALGQIPYQGVTCAAVLLKKPLSPYYVTNITDDWVPFTGVIEMTALADKSAFGGNSLVYLPLYLPTEDPGWQDDDATIRERFLAALERMYPAFDRSDVLDFSVSRARQVLAVSTLDYSQRLLPPVDLSVPNVSFVNAAQIAHGTLNVNETLGLVDEHIAALATRFGLTLPVDTTFEISDATLPVQNQHPSEQAA